MPDLLRLSPFDLFIDPLVDLQDARLRELLAYWSTKSAGRMMPERTDVSPGEIVSHLPSVFLIGTKQPAAAPAHFHVRLMGTALNDLFAGDFTGRTLAEGMSRASASAFAKVLSIVCALRRPMRLHGAAHFTREGDATAIEALVLPLSLGGNRVEIAMGELVRRASA